MKTNGEQWQSMDEIIRALSLVVETRDPYTAGHQRRVAALSRTIAREMELSAWLVAGIHVSGLLHDVGKIGVPESILNKRGRINKYEYSVIKNHCRVGYEILQRTSFPWAINQAVLQHHERLDGSGYPGGLVGKDIVLEAKIIGVADVVEAISSQRPYRPSLGLECAMEEISQASGILYDTEVVRACLSLFKRNETGFDCLMEAAARPYAGAGVPA